MKTLMAKRRQRTGYADNMPMHMSKDVSLRAFIEADNPFIIFANYSRMTVSNEERAQFFDKIKQQPIDIMELLADLKVLGVKEVSSLLKWRSKLKNLLHN